MPGRRLHYGEPGTGPRAEGLVRDKPRLAGSLQSPHCPLFRNAARSQPWEASVSLTQMFLDWAEDNIRLFRILALLAPIGSFLFGAAGTHIWHMWRARRYRQ